MSSRYAYNQHEIDGCKCPVVATGRNPDRSQIWTELARQYDKRLQQSPSDKGTVTESKAREAWRETIRYFDRTAEQSPCDERRHLYARTAHVGRQIADELGW